MQIKNPLSIELLLPQLARFFSFFTSVVYRRAENKDVRQRERANNRCTLFSVISYNEPWMKCPVRRWPWRNAQGNKRVLSDTLERAETIQNGAFGRHESREWREFVRWSNHGSEIACEQSFFMLTNNRRALLLMNPNRIGKVAKFAWNIVNIRANSWKKLLRKNKWSTRKESCFQICVSNPCTVLL